MHSYLSLTDIKERLTIENTTDDTSLRSACQGATRLIDRHCGRRFQPQTATRYATARDASWLSVEDLLTVTSLKTLTTNSNGTRTYGDTWATTDYDLLPFDAPDDEEPYFLIRTNPAGLFSFPTEARGVEVVGVWGYWLDTTVATTLGAAITTTTATTFTATSGAALEALQTILVDSEQMYITGISSNTITVDRGVNGTTAATHSSGADVAVYRYPDDLVEATAIEAVRLWRRRDAPFGVVGDANTGMVRIARVDSDVAEIVSRFVKLRGVAA